MNVNELLGTGTTKVSDQSGKSMELGQEDFMKLLVAQMKNQDPTNPADNSEFLSQMAQFSMVNGIDNLGSSFNGIAGSLYSAQAMEAAGLVGREVLTESTTAPLVPGKAISGIMEFSDHGNGTTMSVRNAAGELVDSIDLGTVTPGTATFNWSGTDSEGNSLPAGDYSFSVDAFVGGDRIAVPVKLFNKVDSVSVDRSNTNILLHLSSGDSVGFSQISEYK